MPFPVADCTCTPLLPAAFTNTPAPPADSTSTPMKFVESTCTPFAVAESTLTPLAAELTVMPLPLPLLVKFKIPADELTLPAMTAPGCRLSA
jgi:hypothetical protein